MRKIISLSLVALMAILTGCSQDESISNIVEGGDSSSKAIIFTPMEFDNVFDNVTVTRGAQSTKANLTAYGVSAAIYPASSTYTSAGCGSYFYNENIDATTGNSGYYWPGADYKVSFYAYAPYNSLTLRSKNDLGYPVYSYTVPSAIANQADFITANVTDHSGAGITDPVPLTFSHQCADIRFNVYNQGSDAITIHSISVYGVKYSGTFCEGNSPKWTLNDAVNSSSSNPFTLTLGTSVAADATVDVTGTTNHFIMLPQTVASGIQIFDVDATVSGTRKHYYHTLTSSLSLLAEKSYNFKLTLGEGLMIVDTETDISDWAVETKYLTVNSVGTNGTWSQPSVTDGQDVGIENWVEEE